MEYARLGLGPWAGYTIGWLYWYFWIGVVAFEAVVAGDVLAAWMPGVPAWLLATIATAVLTATNLISLRSFGEVEFWLASIKVATIIVFLIVGTLFVLGMWPNAAFAVPNLWQHDGFMPKGPWAIVAGVAVVIFSYFGTEIATMAGAESDDPARGIARATKSVVWRIMAFYVGGVFLLVMITPWNQLPEKPGPFAHAFGLFGLPGADTVMNVVVLTAAISVLNSGIYSASRMLTALSGKHFAPRALGRRSPKTHVPTLAVLATAVAVLVIVTINYALPEGAFSFIMNSAGAVALFVYAFIALTQLALRNRMTPEQSAGLKLKMWLHPWLAILVIVLVLGVVGVMMFLTDDSRQQVFLSLGCFAVLLVV